MPTTTSFAIAPVNSPTVACQLSSCTPIGLNSGVMTRLTEASAESLMLSTALPLSEKLFSALRKILTTTITLPARRTKPFSRCQVWISRLFRCGT
ncbi:hypothetical protein D3C76_1294900 [compost metagenome]